MSGIELYQHLASSNPALANRMILITGDWTRTQSESKLQDFKAQFLYKPFSRSELIEAVSRVLSAQPGGKQSA